MHQQIINKYSTIRHLNCFPFIGYFNDTIVQYLSNETIQVSPRVKFHAIPSKRNEMKWNELGESEMKWNAFSHFSHLSHFFSNRISSEFHHFPSFHHFIQFASFIQFCAFIQFCHFSFSQSFLSFSQSFLSFHHFTGWGGHTLFWQGFLWQGLFVQLIHSRLSSWPFVAHLKLQMLLLNIPFNQQLLY